MEDDTGDHQDSVTEELLQIFGDFADYIDVFLFEIVTFLAVVNSFITLVYDILRLCGFDGWKMGFLPTIPFTLSLTLFVFGTKKRKNKRNNKAATGTDGNLMESIDELVGNENNPEDSAVGIPSEVSHSIIIHVDSDDTNDDKLKGILPASKVHDNVLLQVGDFKGGAQKAMKTSGETTLNFGESLESGQIQNTVLNTKDLVGDNVMADQTTGKVMMGAQMLNATRKKGMGQARRRKPKSLLQIYRRLGRLIFRVVCRRTQSPPDGSGNQTEGSVSENVVNANEAEGTPNGPLRKIARLLMQLHRLRNRRPKSNGRAKEDTNVDYREIPSYENQTTEDHLATNVEDKTSHESVLCEDKKIMNMDISGFSCLNNKSEMAAQMILDTVLMENMKDSATQTENEVVISLEEDGSNRNDSEGLHLEKEGFVHSVASQQGTDYIETTSNDNYISLTSKDLESTIVIHSHPFDPGNKSALRDIGDTKEPRPNDEHGQTSEQMCPLLYPISLSDPSLNTRGECLDSPDSEKLCLVPKETSYTSLEILDALDF